MPSVTSCTLQRHQPDSSTDELGRWSFSLNYDVETDGVMGHRAIWLAAQSSSPHAFPSYGATYSYQGDTDGNAYLMTYSVSSVQGHQKRYVLTANFAPIPDSDVSLFEPNPFLRAPVVWFDRESYSRIVDRDVTGKALTNAAKRAYDTPLEQEDIRTVLVIEFNVESLALVATYARFLSNAVNSTTWTVLGIQFPPRTVLAREVAASPPIKQGAITYYHLSFRFVFANGDATLTPGATATWDVPILERGHQALRVPNEPGSLQDPEAEPFLLAADGTKLPDGELGVFTYWRVKREVDFNLLPFSG